MSDNTEFAINSGGICPVCKMSAIKKCSACNIVHYCSREHQKSDWKLHSKNCFPLQLVDDPTIGRRYIATRRIKLDEIVLREDKPLITIPPALNLTCLNCYRPLTIDNAKQCNNCGWHLCHDCTSHGSECELTLQYRKSKVTIEEYVSTGVTYNRAITVMRALDLRENDPDAYRKYLEHEAHCIEEAEESKKSSITSRNDSAKWIQEYVKIVDVDLSEIAKIIGIAEINSEEIQLPSKCYVGVYDKTAYFEHSCRSNCRMTGTGDGTIIVRAITTIEKGHPLTSCYYKRLRGTAVRRSHLKKTKFFDCTCERCEDPTELGTMLNAIKCIDEKCTGYMLPPTFMVLNDEKIPDFVCDMCSVTIPSELVDKIIEDMNEECAKVNEGSFVELKKFIDKQKKILHENHFVIAKINLLLSMESARDLATMSVERLKENVELRKKLSQLLETLMPDQYYYRGIILYQLYLCNYMIFIKRLEGSTYFENIRDFKETLFEASRLLRHEPLASDSLKQIILEDLRACNTIEQEYALMEREALFRERMNL